jgi:hypothetical protein
MDGGALATHRAHFRATSVTVRFAWLAVTGLAAMILTGCTTMHEAAEEAFLTGHPGCKATVRERGDLPAGRTKLYETAYPGETATYEVTGCGSDVIYLCQPKILWQDGTGGVIAKCVVSGWCAQDGCDSVELAARNTFVKDKACPLDRVTVTMHAPVRAAAPPDVAADPERMRIWTETHKQPADHTLMTATGCGAEAAYDCTKPSGTRSMPSCVSENPAAPAASTASPMATPRSPAPTAP